MYTPEQVLLWVITSVIIAVVVGLVVWTQAEAPLRHWERALGRSEGRAEVVEAVDGYVRGQYSVYELCQQVPEFRDLWQSTTDVGSGHGGVLAEAEHVAAVAWEAGA